jgi:hypothetical protein
MQEAIAKSLCGAGGLRYEAMAHQQFLKPT